MAMIPPKARDALARRLLAEYKPGEWSGLVPEPKIETSADVVMRRKIHRIYSHGRAIADFRDDGTYHLLVDVMDLMEMGGFPRALAQIVLDKVSEGYALAVENAIKTLEEAGYGEAAKALRAEADREARKAAGLEPSAS